MNRTASSEQVSNMDDINSLFKFYKNISYVQDLKPKSILQKSLTELQSTTSRLMKKLAQYYSICHFNAECDFFKNKEIQMHPFRLKMATQKKFDWNINQMHQLIRLLLNKEVYQNISGFKNHFYNYYKTHPEKKRDLIYSLFPTIFAYFGDAALESKATEFILDILKEIDDKEFIQEIITCFFQSCLGFQDILWNNFREQIIMWQTSDEDNDDDDETDSNAKQSIQTMNKEDIVNYFLQSLSLALQTAPSMCQIFNQYIIRNMEEAYDFFVKYIELSYNNFAIWTHQIDFVKKTLFEELNLMKANSHVHHQKLADCFQHEHPTSSIPNISSIPIGDGFTVPIIVNDISMFFDMLGMNDKVTDLNKYDQYGTIVSCSYYFDFNKFEIKKPGKIQTTPDYEYVFQNLKIKAQKEKREILSFFSLLPYYSEEDNDYNYISRQFNILYSKRERENSEQEKNEVNNSSPVEEEEKDENNENIDKVSEKTKEEEEEEKKEPNEEEEEEEEEPQRKEPIQKDDENQTQKSLGEKEEEEEKNEQGQTEPENDSQKHSDNIEEEEEEEERCEHIQESLGKDEEEEISQTDDEYSQDEQNDENSLFLLEDDSKFIQDEADFTCYALKSLIREAEDGLVDYMTAIEYGKFKKNIERYLCLIENTLKIYSFSQCIHYYFLTKNPISLPFSSKFNQFYTFIMDKRKRYPFLLDIVFPLIITRLNSKPILPDSIKVLHSQIQDQNIIFTSEENLYEFNDEINELRRKLLFMTQINDLGDKFLIFFDVLNSMKDMFSYIDEINLGIDKAKIFRSIFGKKEIQLDVIKLVVCSSYLEELFIANSMDKDLQDLNVNETALQDTSIKKSSETPLTSSIFDIIKDFFLPYLMKEYQQHPDFFIAFSSAIQEANKAFKK